LLYERSAGDTDCAKFFEEKRLGRGVPGKDGVGIAAVASAPMAIAS
jgi:hypothetical protein